MKLYSTLLFFAFLFSSYTACNSQKEITEKRELPAVEVKPEVNLDDYERAYFASGCFWCVEAVFESVRGVPEVISGYAGGTKQDANYSAVSNGITDHAEAVEVYYDPEMIDYSTLLQVFFGSQDPTTLNRQGPDRGRQYRSSIFYQNKIEKQLAEEYIKELDSQKVFAKPIVTEVVPFEAFYAAEDYHQDYEKKNPNQPYVRSVSIPRLNKFKAKFPELLKEGQHLHE